MWPSLSNGAINRILNGDDVPSPVFQILGCKKIPGMGNVRYRLLISDGVTGCPFAMLGSQLSRMVTNKELEKFTIVRVDKCICNQVPANRKVIILLNLTVLVAGNEVNEKLGNPINSSTGGNPPAAAPSEPAINDRAHQPSTYQAPQIMWPSLSNGAIDRILNGEDIPTPVFQIISYEKIFKYKKKKRSGGTKSAGNDRYRLLVSDGVTECPFDMLGSQLSRMVVDKQLEKFTIVRVDKCVCNWAQANRKVIILLNLTVLAAGNEVKEKLGIPVIPAPATDDRALQPSTNQDSQTMWPSLSTGAINKILNGEDVPTSVLQILGCKKIPGAGNNRYRLLISDGVTGCPFAMLGSQLGHMVENKELEKFTIVRVDKYVCYQAQVDRKIILLLNVTVLVAGNEVNMKLGNTINLSTPANLTEAASVPVVPAINDKTH